ncbi:hypothetical protein FW774_15150, partial [Pedobacter sp. BS3]|uniref:discoidin domain-containing protein n=1 Tax=Pedobacter sp. BS3 TaxID=2567937 RepID=UPI001254A239
MFTKIILKLIVVLFLLLPFFGYSQDVRQFQNPSDTYRPWIFWDWVNDMVTRKGITSDLEQFKKFGLSGTLIMLVGSETKDRQMWSDHHMPNPIISQTPEFFKTWQFAAEESARLGLTISTQLGPGWCHSGGPWVKPDQAVQHIAYSEIQVQGTGKPIVLLMDNQPAGKAKAWHSTLSDTDEPKWIQLDLGAVQEITEIRLHPFDNQGKKSFGFPKQFKIEVANRSDFSGKRSYYSQSGGQPDPGNQVVSLKQKKVKARYIRLTTQKNYSISRGGKKQYLLSLDEIEVIAGGRNVAPQATVTTSGSIEDFGYTAAALNDGFSMTTMYSATPGQYELLRPGYDYYTSDITTVAFPDKKEVSPS